MFVGGGLPLNSYAPISHGTTRKFPSLSVDGIVPLRLAPLLIATAPAFKRKFAPGFMNSVAAVLKKAQLDCPLAHRLFENVEPDPLSEIADPVPTFKIILFLAMADEAEFSI